MSVTPLPQSEYVSQAKASEISGMSRFKIHRLVKAGVLSRRRDAEGKWEYHRGQLTAAKDSAEELDLADGRDHVLDSLLRYVQMLQQPHQLMMSHLQAELAGLRQQNEALSRVQVELIRAREENLSQAHERELAALTAEQEQSRKTMIMAKGIGLVDKAVSLSQAGKLVESLTLDQLDQMLLVSDALLTPEQQAQLKALRAEKAKRAVVEANATELA